MRRSAPRGAQVAGFPAGSETTVSILQADYSVNCASSNYQGHFTAYAAVSTAGAAPGAGAGAGAKRQWYHFNDHRVSRATADEVRAQQAYLLFYQRR